MSTPIVKHTTAPYLINSSYGPIGLLPGAQQRHDVCNGLAMFCDSSPTIPSAGKVSAATYGGEVIAQEQWVLGSTVTPDRFIFDGASPSIQFAATANDTIVPTTTKLLSAFPMTLAIYWQAESDPFPRLAFSLTNETQHIALGRGAAGHMLSVLGSGQPQRNVFGGLPDGTYQTVVGTITSPTAREIFVDGYSQATQTSNGPVHTPTTSYLGRQRSATNASTGRLKWAALWNRVLDPTEIFELHQNRDLLAKRFAPRDRIETAYPQGTFPTTISGGIGEPITGDIIG